MAYTAEISRNNPSCFLFLIDQSGSMGNNFQVKRLRKRLTAVPTAHQQILQNLVIRCAKEEGVEGLFSRWCYWVRHECWSRLRRLPHR